VSRRHLHAWTGLVVAIYSAAFIAGIAFHLFFPDDKEGHASWVYGTYKDTVPFLIAIPAAWLGYCFQRRASYLSALRNLWDDLIPAVHQAIQYTYLIKPDDQRYWATIKDLDIVIDSLRGVFQNHPGTDPIGLYPYENLKEIREIISWLCYAKDRSDHNRYWARRGIRLLWHSTFQALLREFDREIPTYRVGRFVDNRPSIADKVKNNTLTEEEVIKEEQWLRDRINKWRS
jgi:hypothetical protein